MGFFDGVKPPPRREPQIVEPPEWYQPPAGVLPAASPQQFTVLKSAELAVTVDQFLVYPNGVQCTVTVRSRQRRNEMVSVFSRWPSDSGKEPPTPLRFGLHFPDGTKWTSIEGGGPSRDDHVVGPIVLVKGGGGGGTLWSTNLWLWPLPAPGAITFYAAWPEEGLEEQSFQIDTAELRALSTQAQVHWRS